MMHISVLGVVLAFIRHMNQIVKSLTIRVAGDQRLELIFMEPNQLSDSIGESVEKFFCFFTIHDAS